MRAEAYKFYALQLKSHRDGENKFHCRFCNYKHAHCSYFKSHMITHSTTRPTFTCGECQKVFFCITAKENHEKSHQIDVCKPHECDKCDQKFKAVFGLFKHNKDDHKIEQIPCKICGRLLKAGSFIPHVC